MVKTLSNMLPLGTKAPHFSLFDTVSQTNQSLEALKGSRGTVILFICNHCPFVKHIQHELVACANRFQAHGVKFIAISSNDASQYPDDGPDKMREEALQHHYPFPYLYDETQSVAKAYQAACTPDCYLFDAELKCVYRGRFDASTPGNQIPVTGEDLSQAIEALIANQPIPSEQLPSMGCNIKWLSITNGGK